MEASGRKIHVWVRNSQGEYLIARKRDPEGRWGPITVRVEEGEYAEEIILRTVKEQEGAVVFPHMVKSIQTEEGLKGEGQETAESWLIEYQNESLDVLRSETGSIFDPLLWKDAEPETNPDETITAWLIPDMIEELRKAGLWTTEEGVALPETGEDTTGTSGFGTPRGRRHIENLFEAAKGMTNAGEGQSAAAFARSLLAATREQINQTKQWETEEADHDQARALYWLAEACVVSGADQEAESHLRNAIRLLEDATEASGTTAYYPDLSLAHSLMETICAKTGRMEEKEQESLLSGKYMKDFSDSLGHRETMDDPAYEECEETERKKGYDFYERADGSIIITGYYGENDNPETVRVPEFVQGKAVTGIHEYAYADLEKLTSVEIGGNIREIWGNPFFECRNLARIRVDEENIRFRMVNNCLMTGDGRRLIVYPSAQEGEVCHVPKGTVVIGRHAFNCCTGLKKIHLPDTVRIIEEGAFMGCTGLKRFKLPKSVKVIGQDAFADCGELERKMPAFRF